ncbi:hypothetical protein ACFL2Q_16680, partial [Thermodesulfobacteriota bacterium]
PRESVAGSPGFETVSEAPGYYRAPLQGLRIFVPKGRLNMAGSFMGGFRADEPRVNSVLKGRQRGL